MNLLSTCLITFNEEHNLPRVLNSVQGVADEIVVVDCGSKDRTVDIARDHGARVITQAWTNFAEQKNIAAAAASHDWILSLDADEELSSALHSSLLDWKRRAPEHAVYEMARRAWYLGGWINHSGWYPDFQRRLYRRDTAHFDRIVHESLQFDGKPGRLHGDLLHYTMRWSWFQNFFLRGGFLDGYRGALIAQMAARSVRLKYKKLGQLVGSAGKQAQE